MALSRRVGPRRPPQIVAMGGGGFSMEPANPLLDDYVMGLTGVARPKIAFLGTASGDSVAYADRFRWVFQAPRARATVISTFQRGATDLRDEVLAQDVIYVGGGNTVNLLAIWRAHGLDRILREAWRRGVVLTGVSAGALCWFEGGTTDSYGPIAPLRDGLGFLPGSFSPHYDGEGDRKPVHRKAIVRGLPDGYAADDGAAAHFVRRRLVACVASRPNAKVHRLERRGKRVVETATETRYLGA